MREIENQEVALHWEMSKMIFMLGNVILQIYSVFNCMWILFIHFAMLFKLPGYVFFNVINLHSKR